jgi:LacI family repressor for deo operon, udp, cdd, tsx, nupC, and nupG
MPTIQDVARTASVSTATVSRVLSNPEIVALETRQKVLDAVEKLAYQPNPAARTLRTLKSDRILIMVPDISNPFYSSVIRGAEEAAQRAGYSVLLGDTRQEPDREEQYASILHRKEADGLIFLGHRLPQSLNALLARDGAQAPVVNACEFSPDLPVFSAHIDNVTAAAEAMDHLYGLGHIGVGVVTGPLDSPLSRDRLEGVRRSARARGRTADLMIATGDFSIGSGERETVRLLTETPRPTAIFCFNDEMALGASSALDRFGLSCPDDVSLVGFDDIRFAQYGRPPLTTVRQPMTEIGQEAVQLLLDILNGAGGRLSSRVLPHELVVRASTAPPRS